MVISTLELPVNETRGIRVSFAIAWPIAVPPQNEVKIPPGRLFFSRTPATTFVIAIVTKGVVGAPFLSFRMNIQLIKYDIKFKQESLLILQKDKTPATKKGYDSNSVYHVV